MISKVVRPGKSFRGLCSYLCKDQSRALVLEAIGVRSYDYRLMARDFEAHASLNPGLQSPVQHIILSYYPGEVITDEKMVEISRAYLEKLSIQNTQYALIRHLDREHPHVHLVLNRVGGDGRTVRDNWLGLRGKKAAQQLTLEHGLKQAQGKSMERTHPERLNGYEQTRYQLYEDIKSALPLCKNMDELKERLAGQQIELLYKYKSGTNEVQGISFKRGDFKFKGSAIDQQFSYGNLQKLVGQKQAEKLAVLHKEKAVATLQTGMEKTKDKTPDLLEQLMRSERSEEQLPRELLVKKKNRNKGLHL